MDTDARGKDGKPAGMEECVRQMQEEMRLSKECDPSLMCWLASLPVDTTAGGLANSTATHEGRIIQAKISDKSRPVDAVTPPYRLHVNPTESFFFILKTLSSFPTLGRALFLLCRLLA
jgi:hypothetical protein